MLSSRSVWTLAALLLTLARPASAVSSINLLWNPDGMRGNPNGTPTLTVMAGDSLTIQVDVLSIGDPVTGIFSAGVFISILFDIEGEDNLDFVGGAEQVSRTGMGGQYMPIDPGYTVTESELGLTGIVTDFDNETNVSDVQRFGQRGQLGSIIFRTNPDMTPGVKQVLPVVLANGVDRIEGSGPLGSRPDITADTIFNGATLIVVPEPTTAALLVASLVMLLAAARPSRPLRRRRRFVS